MPLNNTMASYCTEEIEERVIELITEALCEKPSVELARSICKLNYFSKLALLQKVRLKKSTTGGYSEQLELITLLVHRK